MTRSALAPTRVGALLLLSCWSSACSGPAHRPAVRIQAQLVDDSGAPLTQQEVTFARASPCDRTFSIRTVLSDSRGLVSYEDGAQSQSCGKPLNPFSAWIVPSGRVPQEVVVTVSTLPGREYHYISHQGHAHIYATPVGDALVDHAEQRLGRIRVINYQSLPNVDVVELLATLPGNGERPDV